VWPRNSLGKRFLRVGNEENIVATRALMIRTLLFSLVVTISWNGWMGSTK
jgi:hypothetical protein